MQRGLISEGMSIMKANTCIIFVNLLGQKKNLFTKPKLPWSCWRHFFTFFTTWRFALLLLMAKKMSLVPNLESVSIMSPNILSKHWVKLSIGADQSVMLQNQCRLALHFICEISSKFWNGNRKFYWQVTFGWFGTMSFTSGTTFGHSVASMLLYLYQALPLQFGSQRLHFLHR